MTEAAAREPTFEEVARRMLESLELQQRRAVHQGAGAAPEAEDALQRLLRLAAALEDAHEEAARRAPPPR